MDRKKIISDSIFIFSVNQLVKLKGVLFLPFIISAIGIRDYGVFVQVLTNPSLLSPMATLALGRGLMRYTSILGKKTDEKKIRIDLWTVNCASFLSSVLLALLLFFLSPVIDVYILGGGNTEAIRLSSLIVVLDARWAVSQQFKKSRKDFKASSTLILLYEIVPYLGLMVGVLGKQDILSGIWGYILLKGLLVISDLYVQSRKYPFARPSFVRLKHFFRYSWPLIINQMGRNMIRLDRYFIGYFMGPEWIGYYNIAYKSVILVASPNFPFRNFLTVYMPEKWEKGKYDQVHNFIEKSTVYFLILGWAGLMIAVLYFESLLFFIIDESIMVQTNFTPLIFMLGMAVLIREANSFNKQLFSLREQSHQYPLFTILSALINTVINVTLIPIYGLPGACLATLVTHLFMYFILVRKMKIARNKDYYWKLFAIALSGAVFLAPYYVLNQNSLLMIFTCISIGSLLYITLLNAFHIVRFESIIQFLRSKNRVD